MSDQHKIFAKKKTKQSHRRHRLDSKIQLALMGAFILLVVILYFIASK